MFQLSATGGFGQSQYQVGAFQPGVGSVTAATAAAVAASLTGPSPYQAMPQSVNATGQPNVLPQQPPGVASGVFGSTPGQPGTLSFTQPYLPFQQGLQPSPLQQSFPSQVRQTSQCHSIPHFILCHSVLQELELQTINPPPLPPIL